MKFGKKLFLPLILLVFFVVLFSFKALAQTAQTYDVTISPVFFDLTNNPGDSVNEKIRIRNNTSSPLPIKLQLKSLGPDTTGKLTLKDTASDDSLSWIKFTNGTSFVAKPLEWTDVNFTISIPKEAAYGYYFAVSFNQDNSSPFAKTGAKITGAAAVPILLNVKKEGAKADAKIVSFSVKNFVSEYLPVDFITKVQNQGNIHVRPQGNIFISSQTGKDIAVLDVNPGAGNIIPSTIRTFESSWIDGFLVREPVLIGNAPKLDKNGKPIERLVINWDKLTSFRIGKYTANLVLVFDNGTRDISLSSTISFWVLPYKAIIVIIIVIILLILAVRFLIKRYVTQQIQRGIKQKS